MSKRVCMPVIQDTPQGKLQGQRVGPGSDVNVFKGIPYGVPPIGDRRWQAPEKAPGWTGVRDASTFAPDAMQNSQPDNTLYYRHSLPMSEDCLYLNVWIQSEAVTSHKKCPVMVWIHGGGLVMGGASEVLYDGAELARKGVVVVTINYRLGIFGYFAHPELSAESDHGVSGNYGTQDQILALQWVRKNISAFGGDPDNVTIFGESAGSWSVSHLLASPLAKGLFHKAVGQSGAYFFPMRDLKQTRCGARSAEATGKHFANSIGVSSLADLRRLPAYELQQAANEQQAVIPGELAVIDGWVFPQSIYDIFAQGQQNDVPVIVGFNADEGSGLSDHGVVATVPSDAEHYIEEVNVRYGDLAEGYLNQYPANNLQDAIFNAYRDSAFGWHMQSWARMTENVSSNAYLYYFSHTPPGAAKGWSVPTDNISYKMRQIGALHAGEISYVFSNLKLYGDALPLTMPYFPHGAIQENDLTLANTMSDYWVAFAKSGEPKTKGLPEWKPYTEQAKHFMEFNQDARPGHNLLPGAWDIQEKIYQRRRELELFWTDSDFGLNADLRTVPINPLE